MRPFLSTNVSYFLMGLYRWNQNARINYVEKMMFTYCSSWTIMKKIEALHHFSYQEHNLNHFNISSINMQEFYWYLKINVPPKLWVWQKMCVWVIFKWILYSHHIKIPRHLTKSYSDYVESDGFNRETWLRGPTRPPKLATQVLWLPMEKWYSTQIQ